MGSYYTSFEFLKDIAGNCGTFLGYSPINYNATLAATTDTTLTVPGNVPQLVPGAGFNYVAVINVKHAASVWFALNDTAATPAGGSFASTTSMLLNTSTPTLVALDIGDVMHFYTAASGVEVSVSFFLVSA